MLSLRNIFENYIFLTDFFGLNEKASLEDEIELSEPLLVCIPILLFPLLFALVLCCIKKTNSEDEILVYSVKFDLAFAGTSLIAFTSGYRQFA